MTGHKNGDLNARGQVQFFENMLNVDLHRGLGNVQFAGDVLVAQALGDQKEDVFFTGRQFL
jgi:hypothetical protein